MGDMQDSSGSLPEVDEGETGPNALLSSARLRASITKIARKRGLPERWVEDVVHDTLKAALTADLPGEEDEARKYVHRIAANAARLQLKRVRDELEEPYDESDADPDDPDAARRMAVFAQPPRVEDREVVRKVVDAGYERFPRTFPWFLRSRVLEETAAEIAKDGAVQASHVRHEISVVQRFVRQLGERLGAIVVLALFMLAGGLAYWIRRPAAGPAPSPVEAEHVAPSPEPTVSAAIEPTPAEKAATLRAEAQRDFDQGGWMMCIRALDAADQLDPAGAAATSELRAKANKELDTHFTKDGKPLFRPGKAKP
ncbi:MAG: hypothetical protein ACRENE_34020 [Polyangiaceae bacterium]